MAAKAAANKEKVGGVINTVLKGLDEHIADYIIGVLEDDPLQRDLEESVGPFLLSTEYAKDDPEVTDLCVRLSSALSMAFGHGRSQEGKGGSEGGRKEG
eukprot:evm.model.NODE_539_length_7914_cov_27.290876.4